MKQDPAPASEVIDWHQVRERLERATSGDSEQLSPEQAQAILEDRAQDLAKVPPEPPQATEVLEILTFALHKGSFGVATTYVREVHRQVDFTPLPGSPDFLVGLTHLRGQVLAFFDVGRLLGLPALNAKDRLPWVIVLGGERPEFGVAAESVIEVLRLRKEEILDPQKSIPGVNQDLLQGVTEEGLLVIDGALLLRDPRLFISQGDEGPVGK